jgi:hypothetical protein
VSVDKKFLDQRAEAYLKYDYTETKDLCKHFITVIVAVLVFSLTLAEKIINFKEATRFAKMLLFFSWGVMILSIITCGIGLCYNSLAGGRAAAGLKDYKRIAPTAYIWIFIAGICFVLGLILLIGSAAAPIFKY